MLRWIAVAFVRSPALLLLLQASHAITFGGTYLGLIGFMVEAVDPRKVARTQGVYIAMFGGFNALLTLAVGNAYDALGSLAFLASAVPPALALVILVVRSIALRDRIKPGVPD